MKRLAVYCGSASPADPVYIDSARAVGRALAERGIGVVYGGGRLGLMGAVADGALDAGGEVIGIIPTALVSAEVAHRGLTELHVVDTMHQRKQAFTDPVRRLRQPARRHRHHGRIVGGAELGADRLSCQAGRAAQRPPAITMI